MRAYHLGSGDRDAHTRCVRVLPESEPVVGTRGWADWNDSLEKRYTLGMEEEVMLLERPSLTLSQCNTGVIDAVSEPMGARLKVETHASVVEFATRIHPNVRGAAIELLGLRRALALELAPLGLAAAVAGTHPLGRWDGNRVSDAERYERLGQSMRSLLEGPPTMGLHVHVGVPDPEDAVRVLNAFRAAAPLLLALGANSPFCQGRDGGLCSERTLLLERFPRSGLPRRYRSYADYVLAIDGLIAGGALQDPTYLWWDVRLQPALGTVEVRVMDGQSQVSESAALAALVQSMARLELEEGAVALEVGPELLRENRFIAARDGMDAALIASDGNRTQVRLLVDVLLDRCRPHAAALGCADELDRVEALAERTGADRQREWLDETRCFGEVSARLAGCFTDAAGLERRARGSSRSRPRPS
jgi:glutamate---cysteine ligase / carboxylate-amine ligase